MNPSLLGPFAAFLSSVTWAYGSANYSKLSRDHRPMDVNFTRAAIAFPCFVFAAFLTSGGFSEGLAAYAMLGPKQFFWLTLSMISSYALGDLLFLASTIALGVPGALSVASGYVILTAMAGVLFENQPLVTHQWGGLLLAVAGIVVVILNDPKGVPTGGSEVRAHPLLRKKAIGVLLAVGTAFAWASNSYSVAKGGAGINPAVGNTFRMGMAMVLIMVISFVSTRRPARLLARPVLRRYAWVFTAESFLGSYFFMYGLSNSSLVLASTLSSLAPVISVPVAIAMKLERFSWVRSFAVLTVVIGLSLIFQ